MNLEFFFFPNHFFEKQSRLAFSKIPFLRRSRGPELQMLLQDDRRRCDVSEEGKSLNVVKRFETMIEACTHRHTLLDLVQLVLDVGQNIRCVLKGIS